MLLIISVHVLRLTKKDTLCFKVISVPSASAAATAALKVKDFIHVLGKRHPSGYSLFSLMLETIQMIASRDISSLYSGTSRRKQNYII